MTNLALRVNRHMAPGLGRGRLSPMAIAVITMVVFVIVPLLPQLTAPLVTPDEGLLITYPEQMLMGRWPNRDFFTSYGPGGLALLAGVFKVAGSSVEVERIVGLGYHLGVATGVMMMLRGRGAPTAGVAGVISALTMMGLGPPAFVWLGALACLVWSVALLQGDPSKVQVVLAGSIAALSVTWRPDIAPALIVANGVLTVGSPRWWPWLTGAVLGSIPLAVHGAVAGEDFYRNIVSMRLQPSSWPSFLSLTPLNMAGVGVIAVCILALCLSVVRAPSRFTIATFGMALLLLPQCLQRVDREHILYVACILVPLAAVEMLPPPKMWRSVVNRYGKRFSVTALWSAVIILAISLIARSLMLSAEYPTAWLMHESKKLPVASVAERNDLETLIREANHRLPPGSKVFVGATDMAVPNFSNIALYHLLPEYVPSSYFLELPGPGPATTAQLASDIRRADGLFLSAMPESERRLLWPDSTRGSEAANDVVSSQFCLVKQAGHTFLFFKCER